LKILQIIPNLRKGGAERLVTDIVRELDKQSGVEVKLVLLEEEIVYDVIDMQHLLSIIPAKVSLSFIKNNNLQINELQNLIEVFQPNIIHSHLFFSEIVSRSCIYPKAKWFSHCHDNMIQFKNFELATLTNKAKITNFYEKKYLFERYKINGGTHFIAISNDTKTYFENTAQAFPITLLHNAINFDKFYTEKQFDKVNKTLRLINVGSLVEKKNQKLLIEVVEKLVNKGHNVSLQLLGDGKNKNLLEGIIKDKKLSEHVFLRGNVDDVEKHLWNSDIYVHSAIYEPLGLVLLEAMAAGLPVITTDGKGNRDLIEQGENGYMLDNFDAETFANKIIEVWNDKNKYQNMSASAQEFAKKFDIKNYVDKLLKIYNGE
jgi:glycosyltransferase involved in cell wall biosynthesis